MSGMSVGGHISKQKPVGTPKKTVNFSFVTLQDTKQNIVGIPTRTLTSLRLFYMVQNNTRL